ncbi:MAG: hypothetical protein QME88_02840 [Actinomycetota bacterium]|nr:hypothetical protein [Actinomycetota bacterium]
MREMIQEEILLTDLVSECLESKRDRAHAKGLTLVAENGEDDFACRADRGLLRSALNNMIEAAMFYSRAGSAVKVSWGRDDTREHIRVSCERGTIPFEELRTTRDLFCRPISLDMAEIEGLREPLGYFSVIKDLADLHGGAVGVRNADEDGVVITLYLPRRERGAA